MNLGAHEKQLIVVTVGAILIFGVLWWGVETAIHNDIILTKQITITYKICPVSFNYGEIWDFENNAYFVPLLECDNYIIGSTKTIRYNHIHQMTIGDWADFERIVENR